MSIPTGYYFVEKFRVSEGTETPKELKADAPKVRLRSDLYAQIKGITDASPRGAGLSQTGIVDEALEQWLERQKTDYRPAPAPRNEIERQFVTALLAVMREPEMWEAYEPVIRALLRTKMPKAQKSKVQSKNHEGAA